MALNMNITGAEAELMAALRLMGGLDGKVHGPTTVLLWLVVGGGGPGSKVAELQFDPGSRSVDRAHGEPSYRGKIEAAIKQIGWTWKAKWSP